LIFYSNYNIIIIQKSKPTQVTLQKSNFFTMNISSKLLALSAFNSMLSASDAFTITTDVARLKLAGPLYSTIPGVNGFGTSSPAFPTTGASPDTNQSWKVGSASKGAQGLLSKEDVWEKSSSVIVQGGSLRTCSFEDSVERVQVILKSEGRPLNSKVELWQGPDNTPQNINVYLEDGGMRQFRAIIETPRASNAVCVRNTANMEFPLSVCVDSDVEDANGNSANPREMLADCKSKIVQGGAVNTTPFPPSVSSVMVLLQTDGRPLNARIELLQGPNNNKQVMEVYIEDGSDRPFFAIIDTPGSGNVVRIVNTSTVEFPLNAVVEAYESTTQEDQSYSGGMTWSD
jgi:hypothetical protein